MSWATATDEQGNAVLAVLFTVKAVYPAVHLLTRQSAIVLKWACVWVMELIKDRLVY